MYILFTNASHHADVYWCFCLFKLLKIGKPDSWCLKCLSYPQSIAPMKFFSSWHHTYLQWIRILHSKEDDLFHQEKKEKPMNFWVQIFFCLQVDHEKEKSLKKKVLIWNDWLRCVSRIVSTCTVTEIIGKIKRKANAL